MRIAPGFRCRAIECARALRLQVLRLQKQLMRRRKMRVERQNGSPHGPRIGADRPFNQLRPDHPFPRDAIELALRAANDLAHQLPIDLAIHHNRFEIDECGRSGNGRGNGLARLIEPLIRCSSTNPDAACSN